MSPESKGKSFRILYLNGLLLASGFIGLFLMGYGPFRSFLWCESCWKWLVQGTLGISWSDYVSSDFPIQLVRVLNTLMAFFFGLAMLSILFDFKRSLVFGLKISAFGVFLFSVWDGITHFWRWAHFLEHAARAASLFLVLGIGYAAWRKQKIDLWCRYAIAFTFIGHGAYALNWVPRPGHFVDMTILLLGVEESSALIFLQVVGFLDVIAAILVIFPFRFPGIRHLVFCSLIYMVFWGFATAIARIGANFYLEFAEASLLRWIPEVLIRSPHFLIPLYLLVDGYPSVFKASSKTETG